MWPIRGIVAHEDSLYFTAGQWPTEGVYIYRVEAATGKTVWIQDRGVCFWIAGVRNDAAVYRGIAIGRYGDDLRIEGDLLALDTTRYSKLGEWTGKLKTEIGLVSQVSPDYFRTMRIPLLAGRTFRDDDREGRPLVAIVNEEAARRFGLDRDVVGRQIFDPGEPFTIVGLVGDVRARGLETAPFPQFRSAVVAGSVLDCGCFGGRHDRDACTPGRPF